MLEDVDAQVEVEVMREDGADDRGYLTRPILINKPDAMSDTNWEILQDSLENLYICKRNNAKKDITILTFC